MHYTPPCVNIFIGGEKIYRFIIALLILSFVSVPAFAETTLGLELYPDKMDGIFNNGNLVNGEEWFATTVDIEKTFLDHLTINFNIKTFLFGTNGFSYYPSSVKFINSVSYSWSNFKFTFSHYCHHYFHQYDNNYSEQNKFTIQYLF